MSTRTRLRNLVIETRYIDAAPSQWRLSPTHFLFLSYYNTHTMIRSSRFAILALFVFVALSFLFLGPYKAQLSSATSIYHDGQQQSRSSGDSQALLTGHAIAPKLGNATAKYVQIHSHGHKDDVANTA